MQGFIEKTCNFKIIWCFYQICDISHLPPPFLFSPSYVIVSMSSILAVPSKQNVRRDDWRKVLKTESRVMEANGDSCGSNRLDNTVLLKML